MNKLKVIISLSLILMVSVSCKETSKLKNTETKNQPANKLIPEEDRNLPVQKLNSKGLADIKNYHDLIGIKLICEEHMGGGEQASYTMKDEGILSGMVSGGSGISSSYSCAAINWNIENDILIFTISCKERRRNSPDKPWENFIEQRQIKFNSVTEVITKFSNKSCDVYTYDM